MPLKQVLVVRDQLDQMLLVHLDLLNKGHLEPALYWLALLQHVPLSWPRGVLLRPEP
jgi:hypothetical protein